MIKILAEAHVVAIRGRVSGTIRLQNQEDKEVYINSGSFDVASCAATVVVYGSSVGMKCSVECARGVIYDRARVSLPPQGCIEEIFDMSQWCSYAAGEAGESHGVIAASLLFYSGGGVDADVIGVMHYSLPWTAIHVPGG